MKILLNKSFTKVLNKSLNHATLTNRGENKYIAEHQCFEIESGQLMDT